MTSLAFIGNFNPPFSTENDVRHTLLEMGHTVHSIQEDDITGWRELIDAPGAHDVILWTSTNSLQERIPRSMQFELLYKAALTGTPTVGFHLDRWWGLERWRKVLEAPFFRCEYVFTADGAHDRHFEAAGINHHFSPPAIAPRWAQPGEFDPLFKSDIAFVGSWQGGYHREWGHREALVKRLKRTYGERVRFWPRKGEEAIRGTRLADLYASVKIVIGDSCLVPTVEGEPMHHYCSDRVFETIGRGGFLLHPQVRGIVESPYSSADYLLTDGEHLATWGLGDWDALEDKIAYYLANEEQRQQIAKQGQEWVAERHTYRNRLADIIGFVVG